MKRYLINKNIPNKQTIRKVHYTPMSTFDVGHLFGIEDFVEKRPHFMTIRCLSSTGSLFRIDA